jgi:hypothetical protein
MEILDRYIQVKDTLEELTLNNDAYDHDECLWDIMGYYECGVDDKDVLRERVDALENLAKAIKRVKNTEIIYS